MDPRIPRGLEQKRHGHGGLPWLKLNILVFYAFHIASCYINYLTSWDVCVLGIWMCICLSTENMD